MHASPLRRRVHVAVAALAIPFALSCGGDSGGGPPEPSSVTVTPGADTLFAINATQAFTAEVLDDGGHAVSGAVVTWSSSDTTVATIDATTGLATARQNGQAQITAQVGDLTGSASAVVAQIVTNVTVTPGNAALDGVGDTVRFSAVARDAGNTPVDGVQFLWSVNDNTVATIDTLGLARAKGAGTVLVSAQAQTRAGYAALSVTQAAASIAFTSVPDSGRAGAPFAKVVQVEIRDSNGVRVRNASLPVTVGVVGGNGPFGMVGSVTITTVDGVTNFPGLGMTRAGSLQLTATAPGVSAATSAAFPVEPDAPTQLTVVSIQDTMTAGDTLKGRLEIQDRFGNQTHVSGVYADLRMRREYSPGAYQTGYLAVSQNVQIVDGKADVFQSKVTVAGTHWQLAAWTPGYDSAFGGDATILPGAPARTIVFFTGLQALSPWMGAGAAKSPGLIAQITDQYLNLQPNALPTLLTLSDSSWNFATPADTSIAQDLFGSLSAMTVNGVAHFDTVGVRRPGPTTLLASGTGLIPYGNPVNARLYGKHSLALGDAFGCVIGDGGPYCWGDNIYQELGGAGNLDSVARPLAGGTGLVSLVAGKRHGCGLLADGTAKCWGDNGAGQLARGAPTGPGGQAIHVVSGAPLFSSITAGESHSCGIALADSLAYCWGGNGDGQLGDSTIASKHVATLVYGGHKFIQIAAGARHTCALEAGALGVIWCWGRNAEGQGGHGTTTPVSDLMPVAMGADSNLSVKAGYNFTCAEYRSPAATIQVRCWGDNANGRLGSDTLATGAHPNAATIIGVGAVRPGSLTVGRDHACVVSAASQLWCWGSNAQGQLKPGLASVFMAPFQVNLIGTVPVGAAVVGGGTFSCALLPPSGFGVTIGDTQCWGRPTEGQLGNGATTTPYLWPVIAVQ